MAVEILHCFSARKNSRALLSIKVNSSTDNLSCLHGIRFICMFILIAFHSQLKFSSNIYNFGTAMKVFGLNLFIITQFNYLLNV